MNDPTTAELGPTSDAGLTPSNLTDAEWEQHFLDYFAAIRAELADSERPIRSEVIHGEVWGHTLVFPYGPYIGEYALVPEPGQTPDWGHGGYEVGPDVENDNPGYRMRPYLIAADPAEPPVTLPYGFGETDAAEATQRIVRWIIARLP